LSKASRERGGGVSGGSREIEARQGEDLAKGAEGSGKVLGKPCGSIQVKWCTAGVGPFRMEVWREFLPEWIIAGKQSGVEGVGVRRRARLLHWHLGGRGDSRGGRRRGCGRGAGVRLARASGEIC